MSTLVADTRNVFQREMSLVLRDPFSMIFSLVQPLVFLALFGPLLAGSVDPAAINGASPLQWFLPGVIVMICLFGTSTTGANLLFEITLGSYERVLAAPLHRSAILVGKALKELAPLVVQAALVVLGIDPVRVQALSLTRTGRAVAARRIRSGHGRVFQCAGHRIAQAGVDVLGSSAVVAVPAVDLVGHDAPARSRPAVDPGARPVQPVDLHRGCRAGAVLWHVRRSSDRMGRAGGSDHLRGRPLGWSEAGCPQHNLITSQRVRRSP